MGAVGQMSADEVEEGEEEEDEEVAEDRRRGARLETGRQTDRQAVGGRTAVRKLERDGVENEGSLEPLKSSPPASAPDPRCRRC